MKILRLEPRRSVMCHDCHHAAVLEVNLGSKRPPLKLCEHDAEYLARVIGQRLEQIRSGAPVPPSRTDDDSRGNR